MPACATTDTAIPAEWSGWTAKGAVRAATKAGDAAKAELTVGRSQAADLNPTPDVKYVIRPEQPGGTVSHGGIFELKVDKAGRYAIALSSAAWIDVLKGSKAQESVAHGHGPDCTSIRKVVDFDLAPGRYLIQIAGNADPKMTLMVLKRA